MLGRVSTVLLVLGSALGCSLDVAQPCTAIFVYGLQAFGDMGILSLKVNLLLACALATAVRLAILTGAWPARVARAARPRPSPLPGRPEAA